MDPCGTNTLDGTVAAFVFELERVTVTPPVPAVWVSVTVPVPDNPLTMVLGLTDRVLSAAAGGLTTIPKVLLVPE